MELDQEEAQAIIAELKRMHDDIRSLISDADDKSRLTVNSTASLKERLTTIKQDIKDAAKNETLSRRKASKTELEQAFFGPAVRGASSNFRMRTDTSPVSSAWARGLHEVESELSYFLYSLEAHLKKNS
ncbi:hypothetical protein [Pseudomonas sp. 6D_7.1_Bac1]|uniref:hypothetical protein n=1 Tax=Pseudomonas sp. 6D_7.1_Bac1 TaxID=2971615 RepID=UPI0021C9BCB3|nr:hypothetical protein [Pseudomonas sp. 6D_7.1_Bac1]MCU1752162.1 hypothetical protein [Pseudomonas sp. 6D_7.1_Bac1]